ncbi:glycogen synthase [Paraburkholderia hospita]|jgi:starch synthase|uniref:Glycogen synthase n=1 Tax=Paraburkholderia hospita TaxID=169430 RepID=A0ABP2PA15_9BURK|nr:glycogen synthase GlgA [Paraburkholderia hospita]EIM94570.1 glycogen synthase [Paraburkholderia hospita]OUL85016.1 starch synthase [Paraburkholderia hospita]OUL86487.1 starch synthase [Paraburkholderia hospita]
MTIRALHVASELYPLLKTGGLADVVGALPPALIELGADARVLLPGFPAVVAGLSDLQPVARIGDRFGASNVRLERGTLSANGLVVYVIRAQTLYDRDGNPYLDAEHVPYGDNAQRFAMLGWTAAQIAQHLDPAWAPQVVHAHDWHAGLAPAYLKAAEREHGKPAARTVFTVHNLAYQGVFPSQQFGQLGLPADFFNMSGVEFYGQMSFLKAGLFYSDRITTVSPTYAREIQTLAQGGGLDGLLSQRSHDLSGILNGVDYTIWQPTTDSLIAAHYTDTRLAGKRACKTALQERFHLAPKSDALLFGVVSRLTEQKGLDLLLAALPEIIKRGGQLVVFGTGDPALENGLQLVAQAHPESVAVELGFDETLAHQIVAGSDVIAVPSRFEPCGLTQLYALAYGSLPLVHRVGGLADTVVDASLENIADDLATGFVFERFEPEALTAAIRRAFALYARRTDWKATQRRAMRQDFGWGASAERYLALYRELV